MKRFYVRLTVAGVIMALFIPALTLGQGPSIAGVNDLKNLTQFNDWMVVTANGGTNMREQPTLGSRIVTSVKFGMQNKLLSRQGDWIKVRPVGRGAVDTRFQRKEGYIHESLLVAY